MELFSTFSAGDLTGDIKYDSVCRKFYITGKFPSPAKITFRASAPADLRLSYAGSGLPFATPEQAYDNTPNQGILETRSDGSFDFSVWAPNAYYVGEGVTLVNPHVHLVVQRNGQIKSYNLELGSAIPNRSLRHIDGRPNRSYGR